MAHLLAYVALLFPQSNCLLATGTFHTLPWSQSCERASQFPTQALHSQSSLGGVALLAAAPRASFAALGRIPRTAAEPWWSARLELALARVRRARSLCLCLCKRLALEVVVAAKRTTESVAGPNFSHRSLALLQPAQQKRNLQGANTVRAKTLSKEIGVSKNTYSKSTQQIVAGTMGPEPRPWPKARPIVPATIF